MIYLHKTVFQSHGYLSSANCHVDGRWVLKVSGLVLHAFREDRGEQVNKRLLSSLLLAAVYLYFIIPPSTITGGKHYAIRLTSVSPTVNFTRHDFSSVIIIIIIIIIINIFKVA